MPNDKSAWKDLALRTLGGIILTVVGSWTLWATGTIVKSDTLLQVLTGKIDLIIQQQNMIIQQLGERGKK